MNEEVLKNRSMQSRAWLPIIALALCTTGCSLLNPGPQVSPPWPQAASSQAPYTAVAPEPAAAPAWQPTRRAALLPPFEPTPPTLAGQGSARAGIGTVEVVNEHGDARRPAIYLAPDIPGTLPDVQQPYSPQVLQAQPGPALSLDFSPNPAWRRATIPPGSNPTRVGRMPPPASTGFVIGTGDTINISVLGQPNLSSTSNVAADGRVPVALVGLVNVAGLSPTQAAERIAEALRKGQFLVDPQVSVTFQEYQSQQVSVLGEVKSPGRFPMRARLSVLDALALAGGIGNDGAELAYILRPEDTVVTRYEVDLDALIQAGAGQQYFELLPGDTVVVPKAELFYIYGEVRAPNTYKLKPGMTVIQALAMGGGLTDKGSDSRVQIRRQSADGRATSIDGKLFDTVQPNDVIYVRERLF